MPPKVLVVAGVVLVVAAPGGAQAKPPLVEPGEGPDPRGLTLTGIGLARVEAPARLSEQGIARAVASARPAAQSRAVRHARRRARALAATASLELGPLQAVADRLPDTERYGPARYCYRPRGRRLRCRVPAFATASLRVTFATGETSAAAASAQAVVASGTETATVDPRRQTSPSIRAALRRAQLVADPLALAVARGRAAGAARAAGVPLGPLLALAEEPAAAFSPDIVSGTFGPGRFCGIIRRVRFRRDPTTGRPRRVRGPRVRRCYVPGVSSVLRVTFAVG